MNGLLKSTLIGVFFILILCGTSFAYTYPAPSNSSDDLYYNWQSIEAAIGDYGYEVNSNFDVNGNYKYTGVGFEAGHQTEFSWTGQNGQEDIVIYNNYNGNQGYNYSIWSNYFPWNEMIFTDLNDQDSNNHHIKAFRLNENWMFGATTWETGTYIIGWGDGFGDGDFDDLIIAAIPNPEPGTLILFGFGLLGLARISRNKQK